MPTAKRIKGPSYSLDFTSELTPCKNCCAGLSTHHSDGRCSYSPFRYEPTPKYVPPDDMEALTAYANQLALEVQAQEDMELLRLLGDLSDSE